MSCAELLQPAAAIRRRGRDGDSRSSELGSEFYGRDPDTACSSAHEDSVTVPDMGMREREVRDRCSTTQRDRIDRGDSIRKDNDVSEAGDGQLGIAAGGTGEGPDPLADVVLVDVRTDLDDCSRDLASKDHPCRVPAAECSASNHSVNTPDSYGIGSDDDLIGFRLRRGQVDQLHPARCTELSDRHSAHRFS
ncbi:hypothetical protein QP157_17620 [Sphingomonas sp. LR61]